MRRNIKGKKPKKKRALHFHLRRSKKVYIFILVFILSFFIYKQIDLQVMPTIIAMAELKGETIATNVINTAVKETLDENKINDDELVSYAYNSEGEVISCAVNTILINEICTGVISNIAEQLDYIGTTPLRIPLGNFTGNSIFSNTGPDIKIDILPAGTATIDYGSNFTSTGINQINHRVWLNVQTKVQVVVPLEAKQLVVKQQITLVDRILSGDVPPNYVNVPEESILDVNDEPN